MENVFILVLLLQQITHLFKYLNRVVTSSYFFNTASIHNKYNAMYHADLYPTIKSAYFIILQRLHSLF